MKLQFFVLLLLLSSFCHSQSIDSNWVIKNSLPAFNIPKNTKLEPLKFVDVQGKPKLLSDYNGKVVYLKLWSTSCGPCIADFPYQEQLLKRINKSHLDTAIVFVNINIEDSKSDWIKALQKYQPVGVNLLSSDSTIFTKWGFDAIPFCAIIDSKGNLIGNDAPASSDARIDWLLYCSAKGYDLIESTWRQFNQNKLMEINKSSKAFTDKEYADWFDQNLLSFIEFNEWIGTHLKKQ